MKNAFKAVLLFVVGNLVFASHLYGKEPVTLKTNRFDFSLSADGYPKSFKLQPHNKELLNIAAPGAGFYLNIPGRNKLYYLSDLIFDSKSGILTAKPEIKGSSDWTPELQFEVRQRPNYIAFHLKKIAGIPDNSNIALKFTMNCKDGNVRLFDFNYMTIINKKSKPGNLNVSWPCLWQYEKAHGYGGFALYYCTDEEDEDDTILRIWGAEGLPHPKVKGKWDYERAKAWVDAFYKRYKAHCHYGGHYGLFAAEGKTQEELYELADYAAVGGFPGVYLMPWVWRGEYWPKNRSTAEINTDIFPGGEKDFKKYSDYLFQKGLNLELHYVSGGIGFNDRKYVRGARGIDPRLALWGKGTLAKALGKDDTTLYFKPAPGTQRPAMLAQPGITRIPLFDHNTRYNFICIGSEIIRVGKFENTDGQTWKLTGCRRGYKGNNKTAHQAGAEVKGLISPYGQVLIADCYKSLFREIAATYAAFMNRCNIGHAAFDGIEIHNYGGFQQGEKFTELVYQALDHPTMAHTSGGRQPKCWISTRLNRRRREWGNGEGNYAVLLNEHPSRIATTPRHAHFMLSQAAAHGVSGMGFGAHDRGITVAELKKHGKANEILQAVKDWRNVVPYLSKEQKQQILAPEYNGRHPYAKIYHEIQKKADGWHIIPVGFMEQDKYDGYWNTAQEHGAMAPKQFVKPNKTLILNNPFESQVPQVVIRVMWATDYNAPDNIDLMPGSAKIKNPTDTKMLKAADSLKMEHRHKLRREYFNINLPAWEKPCSMAKHRTIGMWVDGDSSNALLVASPGRKRYYAVPVDFKGKKYIEIPHGEAYWAQRMLASRKHSGLLSCAKFFDYNKAKELKLGFAKIPAKTNVAVTVSGMKALKEIPSELVNPVIHIGRSSLSIHGTIKSNHYLEYLGGDRVAVYDKNWNKMTSLKVSSNSFKAMHGKQAVSISDDGPVNSGPWLELQLFVHGKPIIVSKGKNDWCK